jgi:hypothetical protein
MSGRSLLPRGTLRALVILAVVGGTPAWAAEDATEEQQIWDQETKMLEKAAAEKDGFNPLERTLVGIVLLDKAQLGEEEKTHLQAVNVGRFSTKGQEFVLRLENAGLLDVLRKAPERKPLTLVGSVRANGKYFVARDVSLVAPGLGSSAPEARRRRGGL